MTYLCRVYRNASQNVQLQMNHRYILLSFLLFWVSTLLYAQSDNDQWQFDCDLGFNYEISKNPNWGINEPVVTYVKPGSPAQFAGLKINDIIMQVRCDATYLRDSILIDKWLKDDSDVLTNQITIRSLDNYFSEYLFSKTCGTVNRLNEYKLASMYEGYSLENSRQEIFTMPIHVRPMNIDEHDYSDYHSFDFDPECKNLSPDLEAYTEKIFANMCVLRNKIDPDFLVKLNFSVVDKDKAIEIQNVVNKLDSCGSVRYNMQSQQMDRFPIVDTKEKDFVQQASIQIEFVEKKNIDKDKFTTIWKADIIENFASNVDVSHYLDVYIPLILMQFPYTMACDNVTFQADLKQFLYTGIEYDANDMQTIAELDPYGPAKQAGVYLGYKVLKIQDIELAPSLQVINQNYDTFLNDTQSYRSTVCYNPVNTSSPRYFWAEDSMTAIQKSFDVKRSNQIFAYLFEFSKFVNPQYEGKIKFEVTNGTNRRTVYVKPELKTMNALRIIK